MISVATALERIFALMAPLPPEHVPLRTASGRVLAEDVVATRDQPPFAASAMDGYALRAEDARPGKCIRVIGASAAGRGFDGTVAAGTTVRIFTGAPVPRGADRVVIQEDVEAGTDGTIRIKEGLDRTDHIRPAGGDFTQGARIPAGRLLRPADIGLLASMNRPTVQVFGRAEVALLATGDELVLPGETPSADQIIASNGFGLSALFEQAGARVRLLPVARDSDAALDTALGLAGGADLLVTTGGASVGAHDVLGRRARTNAIDSAFYKVAMRPGKPLMAGRMAGMPMIVLPGNPVSAMVCGTIFVLPAIRVLHGLPAAPAPRERRVLTAPLGANGPREHYMRAVFDGDGVRAHDRQDSSLQSVLSQADALIVRPPNDGPKDIGTRVEITRL